MSWKRRHRAAASREGDILAEVGEILTPLLDVAFLNFSAARVLMGDIARSQQGSPVARTGVAPKAGQDIGVKAIEFCKPLNTPLGHQLVAAAGTLPGCVCTQSSNV